MAPKDISRRAWLAQAASASALAVLPAACGRAQSGAGQITVALSSRALVYGGLFIAQQAGFFAKRGLNLKLIAMESGNAAITALISGSAQFSGSGPAEVIAARARGQDVAIVLNLYRGPSASVVLDKDFIMARGLDPSMSRAERMRALDGVVLAMPSPTSSFLRPVQLAAAQVGAKPKFVYMAQTVMPAALARHAVQGIVAGAPYSEIALESGAGVEWISGPQAEYPPEVQPISTVCLQTTLRYAQAYPHVIAGVRGAMAELPAYLAQQPERAHHDLALAYPQVTQAAIDRSFASDAPHWVQPDLSDDDIRKEVALYAQTAKTPLPAGFDPPSLILKP